MSGSEAVETNWKNAWNTPTVSCPPMSIWPASTAIVTWHRRMTKRMAGPTAFVRKSDDAEARARSCAASSISLALASSRPNALMTARPLYASSTRPVRAPSDACRAAATLIVRVANTLVTRSAAAANARKMHVRRTSTVNMTTTAPHTVMTLVSSCNTPRWSTSESLSRSFVARLIVSPGWCASK